jgi:hypothetical protein
MDSKQLATHGKLSGKPRRTAAVSTARMQARLSTLALQPATLPHASPPRRSHPAVPLQLFYGRALPCRVAVQAVVDSVVVASILEAYGSLPGGGTKGRPSAAAAAGGASQPRAKKRGRKPGQLTVHLRLRTLLSNYLVSRRAQGSDTDHEGLPACLRFHKKGLTKLLHLTHLTNRGPNRPQPTPTDASRTPSCAWRSPPRWLSPSRCT